MNPARQHQSRSGVADIVGTTPVCPVYVGQAVLKPLSLAILLMVACSSGGAAAGRTSPPAVAVQPIQSPSQPPAWAEPRSFDVDSRQAHQVAMAVSLIDSYFDQGGSARCPESGQGELPRRIRPARDYYGLLYFSRAYGRGDTATVEWYSGSRIREGARVELGADADHVNRFELWCTDEPVGPSAADFWIADPRWVRNVATAVAFVDSLNRGHEAEALALIDDRIAGMSDCDYRVGVAREYKGKQGVASWLQERVADHDQVAIGTVWNHSGSSNVVGVNWGSQVE